LSCTPAPAPARGATPFCLLCMWWQPLWARSCGDAGKKRGPAVQKQPFFLRSRIGAGGSSFGAAGAAPVDPHPVPPSASGGPNTRAYNRRALPKPTPHPSISSSLLTSYASAYFVHAGLHRSSSMRLGHSPSSAMGTGKGGELAAGSTKSRRLRGARKNATQE
jgi:hypothetical protein